jgi:pyruvate,water dikinase
MDGTVTIDAPGFPVVWDNPADAAQTWTPDAIHFPRPLSPLLRTLWVPAYERGFTQAQRELVIPGFRLRVTTPNGFLYQTVEIDETTEAERAAIEATLGAAIGRLMTQWDEEWLPGLRETQAWLRAADPITGSTAECLALIDRVDEIVREDWLIHFRIVMPVTMAMQFYDDLYHDLFPDASEADGHALLAGQPSSYVAATIALSDLAEYARSYALADLVTNTPAGDVMPALDGSEAGRTLAAAIRDYLATYGLQQDLLEYQHPTWQERPEIAIGLLQAMLRSGIDGRAERENLLRTADDAIAAARVRMAGYPEPVRVEFERTLASARDAYYLHFEHNIWIDQWGIALTRLFFRKVGERLVAAGNLAQPDDVFMLTLDEVRETVAAPIDRRALVTERRAELARQGAMAPPPFIGVPPGPAELPGNAIERAAQRYDGGPAREPDAPNQITGTPGSRGIARGAARVALTLEEARDLEAGEILVAATTLPSWTPLFAAAAAIVTETGGPLSHSAIVAREYAIPAVVGVPNATRVLRTGQIITVDGELGSVTWD